MCVAVVLSPEERCTKEGGLDVWIKFYCKHVTDGCSNAKKLGFSKLDLLSLFDGGSEFQGDLALPPDAYVPLYVKEGAGMVTTTTGVKGDSKRLTQFNFTDAPANSCSVAHHGLYADAPDHPHFCYSRQPDVDMRVKLQNKPDGMSDAFAARQAEEMRPHAAGLESGPSIELANVAAQNLTGLQRNVHSNVVTDLVKKLPETAKYEPPVVSS